MRRIKLEQHQTDEAKPQNEKPVLVVLGRGVSRGELKYDWSLSQVGRLLL